MPSSLSTSFPGDVNAEWHMGGTGAGRVEKRGLGSGSSLVDGEVMQWRTSKVLVPAYSYCWAI